MISPTPQRTPRALGKFSPITIHGFSVTKCDLIGASICILVALVLAVYACLGGVTANPFVLVACIAVFVICAALLLVRNNRTESLRTAWSHARPFVVALAIPAGFYFLERPSNDSLNVMDPYYLIVNVLVLALLFAMVYALGQRSRAAIVAFLAACLFAGVANHFVVMFKGQPIVPADLFALSTAASVGSGYAYTLDDRLLECLSVFAVYVTLLAYVPKVPFNARYLAINTTAAFVLVGCFGFWINTCDIEEEYSCTVDVWGVKESYADQGTTLCFLKRIQDLTPSQPFGYDIAVADELLAGQEVSTEDMTDENTPTVITIMNETFSDLSAYPGLEGTEAYPATYYRIASEAIDSGYAYVSALGGGTCNSEFEFLTGSSMGYLGGGVYPYVLYDLDNTESLVSYFSSLGYATHAIHPAESTNWRRDRIYTQLGFDDFSDITVFEDADTLRGLTTDRATYDHALDLLAQDATPQFIFDVTIQNHGGYETGELPEEMSVSVPLTDGTTSAELDEYTSCIKQSDQDLAYFVDALNELDRPVVLCFFGDHQPGFVDWLFEETHDGASADEIGLEAVQERYTVPYMIWANDAARAQGAGTNSLFDNQVFNEITDAGKESLEAGDVLTEDTLEEEAAESASVTLTSLNYLGARLVAATGLPMTDYQRFVLSASETIPAINLNGFMTADETWHWFGEDTDESEADAILQAYAIVQYDNLFDKSDERSSRWLNAA